MTTSHNFDKKKHIKTKIVVLGAQARTLRNKTTKHGLLKVYILKGYIVLIYKKKIKIK